MSRWWIDEPNILGSRNSTEAEIEKLFQEGFRTVISLLDENEQRPYYNIDEAEPMGFDRVSIPTHQGF